jgi:hypothetical protein
VRLDVAPFAARKIVDDTHLRAAFHQRICQM